MRNSITYSEFKYELENAVKSHYGDESILSMYKNYKDSGDIERFEKALGRWAIFADLIECLNHGASRYQIAKEYIDLITTPRERDEVVKWIKYGSFVESNEDNIKNAPYAEQFIAEANQSMPNAKAKKDAEWKAELAEFTRSIEQAQTETSSSNYSPNLFERKQKQLLEKHRGHHHHEHHCHSKRP